MRWASRIISAKGEPFGSGSDLPYSLMYGWPDPALFPAEELAAATLRALQTDPATAMQYGRIRGQGQLIDLVLSRLLSEEGISAPPETFLITTGSASAIGLAARSLLDEGDVVLVEAPTFPGAITIFRATGATMRCVPMDGGGIDVAGAEVIMEKLQVEGIRPKLLYTMPTFHNPTGLTTTEATRRALLDFARRYGLFIIEDDAYHDLYYDEDKGPLPPTLYALDSDGRVMRTGSFSKILAPGVRLGWALAPPDLIHKMMHLKDESGTSPFAQMAAAEFARDGYLSQYIATLRDAYRARRDIMLNALERHMPPGATWTRPMGGFFVWLTLPAPIDPVTLRERAHNQGVDYMPGEACFPSPQDIPPGTHLRLAFSQRSLEEIEGAIARLARAISG